MGWTAVVVVVDAGSNESQTETKLEWQEMKKYRLTAISSQRLYLRR